MFKCSICSSEFIGRRADTKTCSSRCRQILYRMKHEPIERTIILDLTDTATMAALRKAMREAMQKAMREAIDDGTDLFLEVLTSFAMNNPANWRPEKYQQRKAQSPKNNRPLPPADHPPF